MAELSLADIEQLYNKSIILYKGRPTKVMNVGRDGGITILSLANGRKSVVPFVKADFKPTLGRIGFINHGGHAFYAMRTPMRRYSVGLTSANTVISMLEGHRNVAYRAYDAVAAMNHACWNAALTSNYPTFKDAIAIAKETQGSCAFDKQFAIDHERNVFYKTNRVGVLPARASTYGRIEFKPEYQFLQLLIEPNYEKTVRTFEPA